ncbi:MAG: SUMF1/EgtB/PvdO family nonheme iron enzyme [Verrucomicrobiales bacterium]|nr:SUMF1/EgtB/PvdO family nonheme iron enzyme [Verrucomicrobiales bacterium]
MAEPVTAYISSSWLGPLWKKLKAIRGDRQAEIARIKSDFVDPFQLARYYVEPFCQHHNPADHLEDEEPRSAVRARAFETLNDFLHGDFAVSRGGKNQMFILSDAGMGKTSLLVMLRLAHLTRFWPSGHHCALLKLGPETLEQAAALPDAGDTVLLLDALDEDRSLWGNVERRLLEILDRTSHFRRVLISCRTQFFPETAADPFANPGRVKIGGLTCPMIFLSLFREAQVEEYLQKRYPDSWFGLLPANRKRAAARELLSRMRDLRCRPMLLAHIEDLVDSDNRDWDEYGVYEAMVRAWLGREERKLREQQRPGASEESLFAACEAVAAEMFESGSRFLTEARLGELIAAHPELNDLTQIRFGGRSLLNRRSSGDYRFSHFSIQEFLTAQVFLDRAEGREEVLIPQQATEKVVRFMLDGAAKRFPGRRLILRGVNLTRFDLAGADLRGADLQGADLTGADLSGARLDRAIVTDARIEGANLAGVFAPGWPAELELSDSVKLELVWIPPGTFLMGEEDQRQVEVRISRGFWLGKYPVTQEQYAALAGENPSHFTNAGLRAPVEQVGWEDAVGCCRRLGRACGEQVDPNGYEFRLPTEAEWEYACRAGTTTAFSFGDDEALLEEHGWFEKNSRGQPHPVGEKQPNPWGLHDMHGNVWEWCQDWYDALPRNPAIDPAGPEEGQSRVLRGGGWGFSAGDCRSAYRHCGPPSFRRGSIGFRVVLVPRSVPGKSSPARERSEGGGIGSEPRDEARTEPAA